jgi:hypothetical protein
LQSHWKRWLLLSCGLLGVTCVYFERYQPADQRVRVLLEVPEMARVNYFSREEVACLAHVIYNESRDQPAIGQVAVGAVVINRSREPKFKNTNLCEITKQPKQFSASVPKPRRSLDLIALNKAELHALYLTQHYEDLDASIRSWLYFNSSKPRPGGVRIGDHTFYA